MDKTAHIASQLYSNAQSIAKPRAAEAPEGGSQFARVAADFLQTLKSGEETAKAGMLGQADPQSVVMALAASEIAIETAVTLRDKVVEAYQEILRMPV